jgi:hypothetical protein
MSTEFKWEDCKKAWGIRFYPNDMVILGEEAMGFLYNKVGLVKGAMKAHAKGEWDGAVQVLTGKAKYQERKAASKLKEVGGGLFDGAFKKMQVMSACHKLNTADFRELPDKFLVVWADNEKGQVRLDNLDVVKARVVPKKFQEQWNLFLEVLPTITFTFDEMKFYKLGSSF